MPKQLKDIEIPFGAYDSELGGFEYTIPEGYKAEIKDGKVVVKKTESEDEKIRKELIGFLRNIPNSNYTCEEMALWLEKQGEQKPIISNNALREGITHFGITQYQIDNWLKKYVDVEKQGEQKPADKVEPKFREGDWVVYCNDDVDLITGIEENGYCINNGGYIPFVCENEMRLWNITDAKVGDVLVSESTCGLGTWYCIFKSLDSDESMTVYCYLTRDGRFETKKELCFDKDPYNTKPATKEQRDQLEKAMANAGYTFDFDKKELKKIEQKPAEWNTNDEQMLNSTIKDLIHPCYEEIPDRIEEEIKWIKSMRNRVVSQPKQEWSEEDEKMFEHIIAKATLHFSSINYLDEEEINFLKSLKPQNRWKPSDEQIIELRRVISGCSYDIEPLAEMEEQLKKLREE